MKRFANSSSEGFCRPFGAYSLSHRYPRLAPWAAFFRRFAASRFRFVGDINGGSTRDSTYQPGRDRTRFGISAMGIEGNVHTDVGFRLGRSVFPFLDSFDSTFGQNGIATYN